MANPSTNKVYFAKQNVKIMMIFYNENVQISILEINKESIITLLNKLPYLSDNIHLKSRYVHVTTELLKIENRSYDIRMLKNHNTFE